MTEILPSEPEINRIVPLQNPPNFCIRKYARDRPEPVCKPEPEPEPLNRNRNRNLVENPYGCNKIFSKVFWVHVFCTSVCNFLEVQISKNQYFDKMVWLDKNTNQFEQLLT